MTDVERNGNGVQVKGERRGRAYSARSRMAIIATGVSPALLLRMGILIKPPPVKLAARAYLDGMSGLADRTIFRFDGAPLPGYGWIFPISGSAANVGTYFDPGALTRRRKAFTPRAIFDQFVQTPPLRDVLAGARRAGPIKSYPSRTDFTCAPTVTERVMLAGEAAGLVNPLTGEGIRGALRSGQLAAEHLARMFEDGDLSFERLTLYDSLLRQRFQRLFILCARIRDVFLSRLLLDRLVRVADRSPDLKILLINVVLGLRDFSEGSFLTTILRIVLAR